MSCISKGVKAFLFLYTPEGNRITSTTLEKEAEIAKSLSNPSPLLPGHITRLLFPAPLAVRCGPEDGDCQRARGGGR